jgi:hypothetical protein
MTRDEALARYRPVRAAIRRVLKAASSSCTRADFLRAAKLLGLQGDRDGEVVLADEIEADMFADVALFEANQRGNRAYDRFLKGAARTLDPADQELAQAMGRAFFSIFRIACRHEAAGLWLEDLLADGRRLWLMDEALEASAAEGLHVAARLFEAGDFHIGFGIIIPLDEESAEEYLALSSDPGLSPQGRRFVPLVYRDAIHGAALEEFMEMLLTLEVAARELVSPAFSQGQRRRRKSRRGPPGLALKPRGRPS